MNWGEREREMKNGFRELLKQLLFWNEKVWWRNRLKETGARGRLADISSLSKFRTRMSHGLDENWKETQGWFLGKWWAGNSLNRSLWANNATVMTRFAGSQRLSWPPLGASWARLPWKRLVVLQLCPAWGWSPDSTKGVRKRAWHIENLNEQNITSCFQIPICCPSIPPHTSSKDNTENGIHQNWRTSCENWHIEYSHALPTSCSQNASEVWQSPSLWGRREKEMRWQQQHLTNHRVNRQVGLTEKCWSWDLNGQFGNSRSQPIHSTESQRGSGVGGSDISDNVWRQGPSQENTWEEWIRRVILPLSGLGKSLQPPGFRRNWRLSLQRHWIWCGDTSRARLVGNGDEKIQSQPRDSKPPSPLWIWASLGQVSLERTWGNSLLRKCTVRGPAHRLEIPGLANGTAQHALNSQAVYSSTGPHIQKRTKHWSTEALWNMRDTQGSINWKSH